MAEQVKKTPKERPASKGIRNSIATEFKKGYIPWNKGINWKRGPNIGLKQKRPGANGMRKSIDTEFKKGQVPWNKGIKWKRGPNKDPRSQEWKDKLSASLKGRDTWNKGICGPNSHSWKGGKSKLIARIRISSNYKKWRADVFRRDGWTCQTCGYRGHGKDIQAHHIVPVHEILQKITWATDKDDERYILSMELKDLFDVNNGVTLCCSCHKLTYRKGK